MVEACRLHRHGRRGRWRWREPHPSPRHPPSSTQSSTPSRACAPPPPLGRSNCRKTGRTPPDEPDQETLEAPSCHYYQLPTVRRVNKRGEGLGLPFQEAADSTYCTPRPVHRSEMSAMRDTGPLSPDRLAMSLFPTAASQFPHVPTPPHRRHHRSRLTDWASRLTLVGQLLQAFRVR